MSDVPIYDELAGRHHLDVPHPPSPWAGDVADLNDPLAPDPTGDEITDPDHPDYVTPWTG
jgi:hypothetical protein